MKNILIAACIIVSQSSAGQTARESSPQKIKILSWNIYMLPGFLSRVNKIRAKSIGEELACSDYDVLVFQEAFCHSARRQIRKQLDKEFAYRAGPANRRWFSLKINSGIWIWSRFPILSRAVISFKNKYGSDAFSRKGALLVELDAHGKKLQIIGTHLQNSGSAWRRHAQCVELQERLLRPFRVDGTPQIVCGDFNIDKNQAVESYRFMLSSLDAEDGLLNGLNQFSYDRQNNDLRVEKGEQKDLIDYILVRRNGAPIEVVNRQIRVFQKRWKSGHADLSDHYSIEAEIYFSDLAGVLSLR